MKRRVITYFFGLAVCALSFAEPPSIGSTVGSPTVPPSSYQPSMRAAPPRGVEYQLRNELITGNVGGGKHFRGDVPYSPRYEFGGTLGSESVNSFIRRSAGVPYRSGRPLNYNSYYDPPRTVSSLERLGQSGLTVPPVQFPGGTGQYKIVQPLPKEYDPNPYRTRRPLEQNIDAIELKMLRQAQQEDPYLVNVKKQVRDDIIRDILMRDQLRQDELAAETKDEKLAEGEDVSFREEPLKALEPLKEDQPDKPAGVGVEPREAYRQAQVKADQRDRQEPGEQIKGDVTEPEGTEEESAEEEQGKGSFPKIDHQTAMNLIRPYKSFEEYAEAKFITYMKLGDMNMKDGKFYKAADAYSLAAIYADKDPSPYGLRGIALFAAGEYLASMDFLQRAFDLSDTYAAKKIDLVNLIGREMLDKRIAELINCCRVSDVSQFDLLAAYIQYQTGDLGAAGAALDSAAVRLVEDASVDAMRKAIESATAVR